ncbi:UvrD-helicase domain-containing protein, partial [Ameyamaea chiangmaiensis]
MSTPDPLDTANRRQAEASDPAASVFVSASAGSGKTKLLIDRLLQLMLPRRAVMPGTGEVQVLDGTPPGRIVCLTYTKAAAAEMAIRLQDRLGVWVTAEPARLDHELRALAVEPGPETRRAARELFVRVLDLPGGMRIGTIHAFCQSLLRRFPIEAAISPHFALMEDTDARLALSSAVEGELARADGARLAALSAQAGLDKFSTLLGLLQNRAQDLRPVLALSRDDRAAAYRAALGAPDVAVAHLHEARVTPSEEERLRDVLRRASEDGSPALKKTMQGLLDWLAQPLARRLETVATWESGFLTRENTPRKNGGLNRKLVESYPEAPALMEREAERLLSLRDQIAAQGLVTLALSLLDVVEPVLSRYAARKTGLGMVDYNDLIGRTLALLDDAGAAWVLYKLDGGIDHLLLDEVQDTSPEQWRIAGALTAEFFSGTGAREDGRGGLPRTVFAVGDYKQSIYSFQGADPAAFRDWRQRFQRRVQGASATWREPSLVVSFRSTAPVLDLVDQVFAQPEAARGLAEPGQTGLAERHIPARVGQGGRVELWPPVREEERDGDDDGP